MTTKKNEKQENLLVNLSFNIIIPVLILLKSAQIADKFFHIHIPPSWILITALLFPVSYAIYDFNRRRKVNFISVLGFVSILLKGVIGLIEEIPPQWIAVKEGAIPFVIAVFVLISTKTKTPLVKTFIYNDKILDIQRIDNILQENGNEEKLEKTLNLSSIFLACSFFFSSALNFILAIKIVKSPTGTQEFIDELGRMMALSFPVIAVPCTIIMGLILWYLIRSLTRLSGLTFEEMLTPQMRDKAQSK